MCATRWDGEQSAVLLGALAPRDVLCVASSGCPAVPTLLWKKKARGMRRKWEASAPCTPNVCPLLSDVFAACSLIEGHGVKPQWVFFHLLKQQSKMASGLGCLHLWKDSLRRRLLLSVSGKMLNARSSIVCFTQEFLGPPWNGGRSSGTISGGGRSRNQKVRNHG